MKVLVDTATSKIRGTYEEPLEFSISGHYVIDIPSSIEVKTKTDVVSDLVTAKNSAFISSHPLCQNIFNDEYITTSLIDTTLSSRVFIGINKRTVILPGGVLFTTSLTPLVSVSRVFLHYSGFSIYRDAGIAPTPSVARMLYNFDPLILDFNPIVSGDITASVTNSAGVFSYTPTPDIEYVSAAPSPFRLSFTNNSTRPIHMSDWVFLYG